MASVDDMVTAPRLGPSACVEIDGVRVAVVSGKKQLLDRELLRMVGIHAERMRIVVVKSSNPFRADFEPHASHVLVAKAAGPMAADPADLPWRKLPLSTRGRAGAAGARILHPGRGASSVRTTIQ